ncbi:MAG: hypothetical protein RBT19_05860 [Tenuifilaceae bacterium]|jgi:cytochrome c-type biogenesis protein CcmH/NrfG|nr:hypothetical protein [Tenuifilaceae bacterium]NHB67868.1 hypothetical protein [Perlabentimonas gracilis]
MGMITFFKTPKPKRFDYTPQYYDARKEALKERERQIKQEMGEADEDAPRVSLIRGQMRRQYEQKIKGRANRGSGLRLFVIFIILCLLAYYLLYL